MGSMTGGLYDSPASKPASKTNRKALRRRCSRVPEKGSVGIFGLVMICPRICDSWTNHDDAGDYHLES